MMLEMIDYPEPLEQGQVLPGTTDDNDPVASLSASHPKIGHDDPSLQSRNLSNAVEIDNEGQSKDEWSIDKDVQDRFQNRKPLLRRDE